MGARDDLIMMVKVANPGLQAGGGAVSAPVDRSARFFAWFAAVIWTIVAVAAVAMALGNPTAINAVIGCSVPGVFLTGAAVGLYRQDRCHRASATRRPPVG